MKRLLFIPLIALPLLFLSCDGQMPNEPASVDVDDGALFGMAATWITKTKLRCASGVTGGMRFQLFDDQGAVSDILWWPCGYSATAWTPPDAPTSVNMRFELTGGSGTCDQTVYTNYTIPARVKCPYSKKADGTASFSYSKH